MIFGILYNDIWRGGKGVIIWSRWSYDDEDCIEVVYGVEDLEMLEEGVVDYLYEYFEWFYFIYL